MNVDWSKPIELVGPEGVYPARRLRDGDTWPDEGGQYHVKCLGGWAPLFYNRDGKEYQGKDWLVRNVPSNASNPAGEAPHGADSTTEVDMMLYNRMKALCGDLVLWDRDTAGITMTGLVTEARSIMHGMDPVSALIDDLMNQIIPERDKLIAAFEAGRADRFELENGA